MPDSVSVKFNFKRGKNDDLVLYATDELGAEILGALYARWEEGELDLGSFGPATTELADMLVISKGKLGEGGEEKV